MRFIALCEGSLAALSLMLLPAVGSAHHSFAASFDVDVVRELEGEVTAVRWQNPHVEFDIRVTGDDGRPQMWTVESLALSGLRRRDIVAPFVSVGERVKIAGNPGKRDPDNIYLSNLLMADGRELVLRNGAEPRFSEQVAAATGAQYRTEGDGSRPELGIFRVWTTPSSSPFPFPEDANPVLAHTDFPLTDAARATLEQFDQIEDSPIKDCALKGMPTIMEQPYPMEVVERDGNIVLHMEEYDTIRTIYMGEAARMEPVPGILGHSTGRWEGRTLIVETSALTWGWYDTVGIPLSRDAEIVERFTLAQDGSRLDWEMVVTDPRTFTEPVRLEKFFLYVPGVEVESFECTVSG